MAIAADLHDFVAHHVTGILVPTQVARMTADSRPREPDPVLAAIERAATEALASMRRTVDVLRDTGGEADRRPVRVVQEALTHVRRHAADAAEITVQVRYDAGLVGLKERVTALGGDLYAGPRAGAGREVRAVFPARVR